MGCSMGTLGGEDSKQKEKNKEINRLLEHQRKALDNEIKLLLLGTYWPRLIVSTFLSCFFS